jgi:poly(beta-D-mannuronate) lyase
MTSYTVDNITQINSTILKLKKGDTLIFKNGIYENVNMILNTNLITIKAESKDNVLFKGVTYIEIKGSFIHFTGFKFDGIDKKTLNTIAVFGTNNRISCCSFVNYINSQNFIINVSGKFHRIDHCLFENILRKGLCIFLQRPDTKENYLLIDNNKFCNRCNTDCIDNELEIIRIGTSDQSLSSSKSMIINNSFESCDGEIEAISIKSCDNIIYGNSIINSKGTLTLRHGNRNIVYKNLIDGKNKVDSGGIRIIGENHLISNNLITNTNSVSISCIPICILNGQSKPALNGYWTPKNCMIKNNIILNCTTAFAIGHKIKKDTTVKPSNIVFDSNKCYLKKGFKAFNSNADIMFNNIVKYINNECYVSDLGNIKPNIGLILKDCNEICNIDLTLYGTQCIVDCETNDLLSLYNKLKLECTH